MSYGMGNRRGPKGGDGARRPGPSADPPAPWSRLPPLPPGYSEYYGVRRQDPASVEKTRQAQEPIVQQKGGSAELSDSEIQAHAAAGLAGSGSSVPYRAEMEAAFGTSFADVHAHLDPGATAASRSMGAEAYTSGNQIAFAMPSPTPELVAHELAHVVQQRAGASPAGGVGRKGDALEAEADRAAQAATSGQKTDLVERYPIQPGIGTVQGRAVQRYESGEHATLGCGPGYPFQGGEEITLPNGARAFLGELVAFPDFYSDLQQMKDMPRQETEALVGLCRMEAVWMHARRIVHAVQGPGATATERALGSPGGPKVDKPGESAGVLGGPSDSHRDQLRLFAEVPGEKEMARDSTLKPVWKNAWDQSPPEALGKKLLDWRNQIHAQFAPAWAFFGIQFSPEEYPPDTVIALKATLGRRRFRSTNDTLMDPGRPSPARGNKQDQITADPAHMGGDYLDLASNNVSHFAPESWEHWRNHHERACAKHAEGKKAGNRQLMEAALIEETMGAHYLTDRFSSGHTVNKEELMQFATGMMLDQGAAAGIGKRDTGAHRHALLRDTLEKALEACFYEEAVQRAWDEGVDRAFDQKLIARGERDLLKSIPKYRGPNSATIVGQVRDVIMSMPWRNVEGTIRLDADSRNYGPASQTEGQGDYHLGLGNLAALQVHDAINEIGFTAQSAAGKTWRMQGDDHLTAESLAVAHGVVMKARAQVERGAADSAAILREMPSEGWMDPRWIRHFFQGGHSGHFDDGRVTALCRKVEGKRIPLSVEAVKGQPGNTAASTLMSEICHEIMQILFLAPRDSNTGKAEDPSGTGLNISMLKEFLIKRLPEMVAVSYAAASASDLPRAALEEYAPRNGNHEALPRAVNDFRFEGQRIYFNLNVTGCAPREYTIGVRVLNKQGQYDYTEAGQLAGKGVSDPNARIPGAAASVTNQRHTDNIKTAMLPLTVRVPQEAAEPADAGGRRYVPVSLEWPAWKPIQYDQGSEENDDRYLLVYADTAATMCIGRSPSRHDRDASVGNPHPQSELPRVTGGLDAAGRPSSLVAETGMPPVVKGVVGDSFHWEGRTLKFRLRCTLPQGGRSSGRVMVYAKEFDRELGFDYDADGKRIDNSLLGGRDQQIGGVRAISAALVGAGTETETLLLEATNDNPGDTYFVLFTDPDCTHPLGRSEVQGTSRGATLTPQQSTSRARTASGFQWNSGVLRFRVSPADAGRVWLRWYNRNWGYDYDESGQPTGGWNNTDPQVGGIQLVSVAKNGWAEARVFGDANNAGDTYAVIYADADATTPIGRSFVQTE